MSGDDLVIEELAAAEAALLERLVHLEADLVIYRELVHLAFDAIHDLTADPIVRVIAITSSARSIAG